MCADSLQAPAQVADGWLLHPRLIYVVCVCALSLKLPRFWLAAVVLLDGWCMFSACRAGSDTGSFGLESVPISHLSQTMKLLFGASQVMAAERIFSHAGIKENRGINSNL